LGPGGFVEEVQVLGRDLVDKVRELIHEGDVQRIGMLEGIHEAYMQTVKGGTEGRAILPRIAHERPVDAIVLAGTDLSLIYDETNTDFPHVDCAKTHIQAIMRRLRSRDNAEPS
jgi:aspartate/glutamate racemase